MTSTASTVWPDVSAGPALGDGRFALASDHPADVASLSKIVADRVAAGHAIYPQGGRTALEYGQAPGRPGVAVDTTAIARVIEYPAADMTITVEAGVTLTALRAILARERQRALIDAPYPDRATLGGIYATNTSGPRRFAAGRPRDQIIGVRFVTSSGVEVKGGGRVVKNVAGYDFPKLLTGSMGTLGIITQLTLKVRPIPEVSAIAWVALSSMASAASVLEALNVSGTRPAALELLNAPAAAHVGAPLGLPGSSVVLAVGYEDNAAAVAWQLDRLKIELGAAPAQIDVVRDEACATLWTALTDFQAIELEPAALSLVANLRPSAVVPFVDRLDPGLWSVQAHAGSGIVRAHALGAWDQEAAARDVGLARDFAVENGGNLILSRCPTPWKPRLGVWGQPRADWAIAARIKEALDPVGAMNPGRFVGNI